MEKIERLIAVEAIKATMARRVRCLDEKDWDGFADCYTKDAVSYSQASAPGGNVVGNRAIAERNSRSLKDIVTVHQVHMPEIEFVSDTLAKVIWPLSDILVSQKEGKRNRMRGYGHYRQTYEQVGERWLIAEHHLTRLLIENSSEDI